MPQPNNFKITNSKPCLQRWESMSPDGDGRFCADCGRSVADTASMTRKQVELLAMRSAAGESVCARITTSNDGGLILQEDVKGARFSGAAKAVLSMALAAGLPAVAQNSSKSEDLPPCGPYPKADEIVSGCVKPQPPATVTGRLLRPDGSAVNSGLVYLRGDGKNITYVLDEMGTFELHELPGTYDLIVQTGPGEAEHMGAVQLHKGFQAFGDVRTRPHQEFLTENTEYATVGELTSTIRWSWKSRVRHPMLYLRSVFRHQS